MCATGFPVSVTQFSCCFVDDLEFLGVNGLVFASLLTVCADISGVRVCGGR